MITRGTDSGGNWLFGKGRNDYKKNLDACAQNVGTRLRSFLGDCFFNLEHGLDWFNLLGSRNLIGLRLAITSQILNTPDVTRVVELFINVSETRKITIQYEVDTIYGRVYGNLNEGDLNA